MRKTALLPILGLLALWVAGPSHAGPSGMEVLRRVRTTRALLRDYTVDMDVHLQMEGVKIPDLSVRVFYKQPDRVKLKPLKGFALLPKGTLPLGDPFASFGQFFNATVRGEATLAGHPVYLLHLVPRDEGPANPVDAWVDSQRWVVLRLRSFSPAGDPITLDMDYTLQQKRYWLPSRILARLRMPEFRRRPGRMPIARDPTASHRPGTVTATFRGYKVNTGLPDSLFQESPEGTQP